MVGFVDGGFAAYRKSLQQDFEKRLDSLTRKLKGASIDEKREIDKAIREERASYKRRLAQLDRSLF